MTALAEAAALAPMVALGVTVILGLGAVLSASRAVRVRQHTAEWAVAAAALFAIGAALPLPRPMAVPGPVSAPPAVADATEMVRGPIASSRSPAAGSVRPVVDAPVRAPASTPMPTPAAPTPAPRVPAFAPSTAECLVAGYLTLVLLAAGWVLLGFVRLRRLLRSAVPAPAAWVRWLAGHAPGRAPRLLLSARAARPLCCGALRPVVVLPAALARDAAGDRPPPPAVRAALLHELAHLRRGDHRRTLLFAGALPVLIGHPLFWWLRRRARRAAEVAADADAAAACGDRRGYARHLLDLAEQTAAPLLPASGGAAVFIFRRPSELTERIHMLIDDRTSSRARPHRLRGALHALTITLTTAVCIGSWGATPARAQGHDPRSEVDRLRAERAQLAAEVADLRRLVEELRAAVRDAGAGQGDPLARGVFPADVAAHQRSVVVRAGDTLEQLAIRHLGNPARWKEVMLLNPGLDPRQLRVGQRIVLPLPNETVAEPVPDPTPEPAADVAPEPAPPQAIALPPAAGNPFAGSARERGDAVALLTQLIELEGEREQAKLRLDQAKGDRDRREVAAIDLRTTERKLQLVRRMVDLAVDTATAELASQEEQLGQIHQLHERGFVPASELRRAEAAVVDLRGWLKLLRSSR